MKIKCACGRLIVDGTDDLSHKAHIIPDQNWNELFEQLDDLLEKRCNTADLREAACTKIRSLITNASRQAWQCDACGNLYVDGPNGKLHAFAPQQPDQTANLFHRA